MNGQFDVHAVAIAAVGAASVEDPRVKTSDRYLIGSIAEAFKHYQLRVDTMEAVLAVKNFYRHETTSDPITAEGLVHVIRRTRLQELREQQQRRADFMSAAAKDRMADDWDAIRSWDCDDCGAPPGVWCTNAITKEPMEHSPGHLSRIRKAMRTTETRSA